MLSARQMGELLNLRAPASGVLSLYLPVDPARGHVRALAALLRVRSQEEPGFKAAADDLRRLEEFVGRDFVPERWRGLAVFSSAPLGLWRACPLPEPVKAALRLGEQPYLTPLLSIADQYQRYGVALADASQVRFLEVFMGQVKEYEDLAMELGGLNAAEARTVAEKLDGLARNQQLSRIVLGAGPAVSELLAANLRTVLQQNLILDAEIGPQTPAPEVLERVQACESEARKVRESVLAHRLLDLGRGAALGLERVLLAMRRGQVRLLLVRDGFAKMGHRCTRCGDVNLSFNRCPACDGPAEPVFNVVEDLILRALDARCEVVRLLHPSLLDNMGHIGAELSGEGRPQALPAPRRQMS